MYCRYCGSKLSDEDKICPNCGKEVETTEERIKIDEELFSKENIYDKRRYEMEPSFEKYHSEKPEDKGSIGFGILGFFFPIVGFILFFVWKNDKPVSAKHAGIGALIGFILAIVIYVPILSCVLSIDWDKIIKDIENGQQMITYFLS